jgi:hypothetical protein
MVEVILFTAFCMRLNMSHCYITMYEDPFSTLQACEKAIDPVEQLQWNKYYHTALKDTDDGAIPRAHWCTERNWGTAR